MALRNGLRLRPSGSFRSTGHSQEGATEPFSTPHSNKDGIPYESDVEPMDETSFTFDDHDLADVEYGHSVRVTGPSPINDHDCDDKQEITVSMGSIACIRSLECPTSWHGEKKGEPNLFYLKQDDQGFYQTDLLDTNTVDSDTMRVGFAIHQTIDPFLNGPLSIYRDDSTKSIETLETTVGIVKGEVDSLLNDMPESVVLVRCDLPFFEYLVCGSRAIVRHVVVEYFRSPWKPLWKHRVRSALVQDSGPWYESLAGEKYEAFPDESPVEKEDAAFINESPALAEDGAFLDDSLLHDSFLNDYEAQLLQAATTPLFDALRLRTEISSPSFDGSMDFDTQAIPTLDRSRHTTPVQPGDLAHPYGACRTLDQIQSFVNPADLTTALTPSSSLDTTDTAYPDDDGDSSSESMVSEGDNDPSTDSMDTDDNDYSTTEFMDSDTDEDGDNRSLPNVTMAFYLERAEVHYDVYPETKSIASETSNNNGSSSSAGHSSQDYQPPVLDPNTCKLATNLNVRIIKVKSKPVETINPRLARKAETKHPRIFECRVPGCTKAYTTQYSLTNHTNSHHASDEEMEVQVVPTGVYKEAVL
ncbi:hypothetical protein EC957_011910 [Mortierella hygrophila]|uniref:C2H2-type domain-containing protein n=1 Tax=Mortierella hygrophila TaxID=979708 RepID=A0A9P6K3G5_9FUNG|nr:hypothetical protein EC957_011910 [Mortierella hygrophila]